MADAKIRITAEDRTKAAISSARKNMEGFTHVLTGMRTQLTLLTGAAGIGALIRSQIEFGDELAKSSQKLGISVEKLSAYQYAAKLAGVSNDELRSGLSKLAKAMQEASQDQGGETSQFFRSLGVAITDTNGRLRDTSAVFEDLSRVFAGAKDGPEKTAAAMKLLGKSGSELIPLMNSLKDSTDEAKRLGFVVGTDFAKAAERFNDATERMKMSLGTFLATSNRGSSVLDTFLLILKSLQAVGMVAAETFQALGSDIAAVAGAATEVARGEFKAAIQLWKMHTKDMEELAARGKKAREELFSDTPTVTNQPDRKDKISLPTDTMADKLGAQLQRRLEALKLSFLTEQEQEREHLIAKQKIIEESWVFEKISFDERNLLMQEAELQHQAKMGNIRAKAELAARDWAMMTAKEKTQTVLGEMARMTNGVTTQNKAMFRVNQIAGIGNAIIGAHEGAGRTMGKYPFPINVALAGLSLAAGLAQVNAIKSATFGGSTSAPSIGGGSATPITDVGGSSNFPSLPQQVPRQRDTIIIHGADPAAIFTGQQLRDLVERIFETENTGISFV